MKRPWRHGIWLAVFALLLQTVAQLVPMPPRYATAVPAPVAQGDHHATPNHHGAPETPAGTLAQKCQICLALQYAGTFVPPAISGMGVFFIERPTVLAPADAPIVATRRYASFVSRAPPSRG